MAGRWMERENFILLDCVMVKTAPITEKFDCHVGRSTASLVLDVLNAGVTRLTHDSCQLGIMRFSVAHEISHFLSSREM